MYKLWWNTLNILESRGRNNFMAKAKSNLNVTCLSLLPVSGSGEKWTAPEPGQVCRSCVSILSYLVYGALRSSPHGVGWTRVLKLIWLATGQCEIGPGPLFAAPLPAQQVAICDCHAPWSTSNKKLWTAGEKSWLVINLQNGQGGLWLNEIWTALARWVALRLKEFGISVQWEWKVPISACTQIMPALYFEGTVC